MEATFLLILALAGLLCLALIWRSWFERMTEARVPVWRMFFASVGFLAVLAQGLAALAFVSRTADPWLSFGLLSRSVFFTFVVAFPCVLAGRGASRWWLLSSSIALFAFGLR